MALLICTSPQGIARMFSDWETNSGMHTVVLVQDAVTETINPGMGHFKSVSYSEEDLVLRGLECEQPTLSADQIIGLVVEHQRVYVL